jgi:hypothetical protein
MKPDKELAHIEAEDVAVTHMTMMSDDGPLREVLHVAWSIFECNSNPTHLAPMD